MKTLPFDLEKFRRGEPAVTRGGKPAFFLAYDEKLEKGRRLLARIGGMSFEFSDNGELLFLGSH